MIKIIKSEDCGNSPKNIFLEALTIAFAKGDIKFLLASVTDDISWNIIGSQVIEGKHNFAKSLEVLKSKAVSVLTIHHVATHGKVGAVNGTTTFKDGKPVSFCDVYEFNGAKGTSIKAITSYIIETK
ncbi:MAG: nuclear transport factor 2 family protein [Anaerolineales bacterium]